MSIINQMLQELEQRHANGATAGSMAGQVRATPQVRSTHAAWWVAAILAMLLIGLLAWLWLRPVPLAKPASTHAVTPPQLELKLAPDLHALPAPVALETPAVTPAPSAMASIEATPAAPAAEAKAVINEAAGKMDSSRESVAKPAPPAAPLAGNKPAVAKKQGAEDTRPAPRSNAAVAAPGPAVAPEPSLMLDKKIRELTPQQQAENDYRKATGLVQQGRVAEAISLLEHVLQTDAKNAAARQTLIALLLNGKRQDEAARRAQDGLNLDPKQAGFAMILARLQIERGEQQLAIATLQRTLPHALDRPEYQAFLAAVLQREGQHREAVEQYLAALRKAPQNGLWWMGLGISLQADNRAAEAREAFTRARDGNNLSPELQAFVEQKLKQLPR